MRHSSETSKVVAPYDLERPIPYLDLVRQSYYVIVILGNLIKVAQ